MRGEASDENFLRYELSLGEGAAPALFATAVTSAQPANGALGTVDTSSLAPGPWTLRLIVRDSAGHETRRLAGFTVVARSLIASFGISPALISPNGDGIQDTEYLDCPITTICQPIDEVCVRGWEILQRRMTA